MKIHRNDSSLDTIALSALFITTVYTAMHTVDAFSAIKLIHPIREQIDYNHNFHHNAIPFQSRTPAMFHSHTKSKQAARTASPSAISVSKTSEMMAEMRAQIAAENEDADLIMQALRGNGINDDNNAAEGLKMNLIGEDMIDGGTGLPYDYNPEALENYFSAKPLVVVRRITQVLGVGGGFFAKVTLDSLLGRIEGNPDLEVQRAGELRDLITSLGPFYIKLGQALSIRPDILSPRSMVELQKLCDKVPSYDSKIAMATVERELGKTVSSMFSEITPEPVAAASLGQVYKAKLRTTGEQVAVKVQRPGVLETVSLDLYLARQVGLFLRNFAVSKKLDAVALLDEFAYRFFQELDYNQECENGIKIKEQMKVLPMVVIPGNFPDYTARRVHVAEWIDGEKLSASKADDVGALVNLGVITYLTQLLECGFFHAE